MYGNFTANGLQSHGAPNPGFQSYQPIMGLMTGKSEDTNQPKTFNINEHWHTMINNNNDPKRKTSFNSLM